MIKTDMNQPKLGATPCTELTYHGSYCNIFNLGYNVFLLGCYLSSNLTTDRYMVILMILNYLNVWVHHVLKMLLIRSIVYRLDSRTIIKIINQEGLVQKHSSNRLNLCVSRLIL